MQDVMHRYLTEAEQQKLLSAVKGRTSRLARRDHAWMRLLRDTGLRIGEFARISVGSARFALEAGWIFIPKQHRKGGKRDHQVPVTRPVRESIETLLAIRAEFGAEDDAKGPLVISRNHRGLSVRSYQVRIAHWCRAAGIEHASPHWMRHTRAMNLIRRSGAENPLGVVQGMLGHVDLSSTGIYTRVTKEDLIAAAERVDRGGRTPARQVAMRFAAAVGS